MERGEEKMKKKMIQMRMSWEYRLVRKIARNIDLWMMGPDYDPEERQKLYEEVQALIEAEDVYMDFLKTLKAKLGKA